MPLTLALLLAFQREAPRLLIAPLAPLKKDGPHASDAIGNYLAQELDNDGRVRSIVWGLSDPVFRPAALEGRLGDVPTYPTRVQAIEIARRLGAGYVLLYSSESKSGHQSSIAELLQDGRTVWKNVQSLDAKLGNVRSEDDTAASVARTWALQMNTKGGPLADLAPVKVAQTPQPTPGQSPIPATPAPPPPPKATDPAELERRLSTFLKEGQPVAALAFARDAVDADPLSPVPRTALVRLLASQGDSAGAAEEARRAADLLPEKPELRIDAVHRLLGMGRLKEAQEQSATLAAERPNDPSARRLVAEVALAADDASTAALAMDALIKEADDPQARLLRAIARARLGGAEGAAADIKAWADATPAGTVRADGYAYAERMLGEMATRAAEECQTFLQRAASQPKSAKVRDEMDEIQRQAQARAAAFAALPAPEASGPRHDAWALAHRLMTLVAADLRSYLADGSDDTLTSARIDLGEAKRAMKGIGS